MISSTLTIPLMFIGGGLLLGALVDFLLLASVRKTAARTRWNGDNVITTALRGKPLLWFTTGGLYLALRFLPYEPDTRSAFGKALLIVLILSMTFTTARIATDLIRTSTADSAGPLPSTSIFTNLARITVLLMGILVVFQILDVPITPILTTLGIGGLAVALALQDTLSNLFSGVYILLSRKIRVGDFIKLESGEEGYVVDINLRHTTVRELANNMIVIPNSKLATSINRNYYLPSKEVAVLVDVLVSYGADLARVEQVALDEARRTLHEVSGGVSTFEPLVRFNTFAELGMRFTVVLRAQEITDQFLLKHEFIKRLHQRFQSEGIELPALSNRGYVEDRMLSAA